MEYRYPHSRRECKYTADLVPHSLTHINTHVGPRTSTHTPIHTLTSTSTPTTHSAANKLAAQENLVCEYEPPNPAIHSFNGTLHLNGDDVALGKKPRSLQWSVLRPQLHTHSFTVSLT